MPRILTLIALLTLVPGTALAAKDEQSPLANVEGQENLVKVPRAIFRETYVNTQADFSKYDKLFAGDALFDYRDARPAPDYTSSPRMYGNRATFGLTQKDQDLFEEIVGEAFAKELSSSDRFTISDKLGPNTLIMRGAMVDIVSRVPPQYSGRGEVYLSTVGEATLILEFVDGQTGEVMARVAERHRINTIGGQTGMLTAPSNPVTVKADVRRWASGTARRLRRALENAIEGG